MKNIIKITLVFFLILNSTVAFSDKADTNKGLVGVALLIGNSDYNDNKKYDTDNITDYFHDLKNPCNDVKKIAHSLKKHTVFKEIITKCDLTASQIASELREFSDKVSNSTNNSPSLVYLAGHGAEIGGLNYFYGIKSKIPPSLKANPDAEISNPRKTDAVDINEIITAFGERNTASTSMVVFDICRDNPLTRSILKRNTNKFSVSNGTLSYKTVSPVPGMLIAFSTSAGKVALDGYGENSPYASSFINSLALFSNQSIGDFFTQVRSEVMRQTELQQVPSELSALTSRFCLNGCLNGNVTNAVEIKEVNISNKSTKPLQTSESSFAVNDTVKKLRVDIFGCASDDSKVNQERTKKIEFIKQFLSKLADGKEVIAGSAISQIRVRSIDKSKYESLGYKENNNQIRFESDIDSETRWASYLEKNLEGFITLPIGSPTPNYMSIFVCK